MQLATRHKMIVFVGMLVLVAGLGYFAGARSCQPAAVQEKTTKETSTVWHSMVDGVIVRNASHESHEQVRVVTRWLRPDGTVSKEQVLDKGTTTKDQSGSVEKVSASGSATSATRENTERVTTPILRPTWAVTAIPTVNVKDALGLKFTPGLGGVVTRKVAGGKSWAVDAGVFGHTRGDAGLAFTLRFD